MDLITTIPGSLMEGFLPAGWDLKEIDRLGALPPEQVAQRQHRRLSHAAPLSRTRVSTPTPRERHDSSFRYGTVTTTSDFATRFSCALDKVNICGYPMDE